MKPETLYNYQDRCNALIRTISAVYNHMEVTHERYERSHKLFNRANEFGKFLHSDDVKRCKTIELSSRLQALELSVERWIEDLPEDDVPVDRKVTPIELEDIEPITVEGSVQQFVMQQLTSAQLALRQAHMAIVNHYKMAKSVPAVIKLDDLAKQVTVALQDINRLEF